MIIIDSPSNDAYFNIAAEEYLLTRFPKEDILLFYINAPSIIVGKFQNTLAEINIDYVQANNIKVVRRLSGGGTVYHDLGNLNFSFHTLVSENEFTDFSTFTAPVIRLLHKLNVPAKLEGRNDLLVNGKKFSGNLIHYLPLSFNTQKFKNLFIEEIKESNKEITRYNLTSSDMEAIDRLVQEKYATWEWNYGFSPAYNFKKANKLAAGFIEVHIDVKKGYIENIKIFGDFFASKPIEELEQLLINVKHDEKSIKKILETVNIKDYFGKVNIEELINIFK